MVCQIVLGQVLHVTNASGSSGNESKFKLGKRMWENMKNEYLNSQSNIIDSSILKLLVVNIIFNLKKLHDEINGI